MEIGFIPDLHIDSCHEEEILEELHFLLGKMEDFDHVFFLGDFIEKEYSISECENKLEDLKRVSDSYQTDHTFLLGNNEIDCPLDTGRILEILDQEREYGLISSKIDIFYLNTSDGDKFYEIGEEQENWLVDKVRSSDSPSLLVSHHPIAEFDLSDNYWMPEHPENLWPIDCKRVISSVRNNSNLIGSISAHVHRNKRRQKRNERHFILETLHKRYDGDYVTGNHCILELTNSTIEFKIIGRDDSFELKYELERV